MNTLEQRLADAASSDCVPPLHQLLEDLQLPDDASELLAAASGPLAPLACRASVQTVEETGVLPPELLKSVLSGLTQQSSLLALLDATETLLDSGAFVTLFGQQLCDALLAGHAQTLVSSPLIAVGHIEGALRLAMASLAKPLRVLGALEFDDAEALDPDYADRLPRLLGAALDKWAGEPSIGEGIRESLISLQRLPDAAADATFEYGLDLLRQTAAAQDSSAFDLLLQAREQMGSAVAAEEARDDAALYAAGIDAVLAFSRSDRQLLTTSRDEVTRLLNRREAWLRGFHQPAWRRSRREAERAWGSLLLILHTADEHLADSAWLDAWSALEAILQAYRLDRGCVPVPGLGDAPGLGVLIQPAVESRIVSQQAFIATLSRAIQSVHEVDDRRIPASQLQILNDRVQAMIVKPGSSQTGREASDNSEADSRIRARLITSAPATLHMLGERKAIDLAQALDENLLNMVEGIAHRTIMANSATPPVDDLMRTIRTNLDSCDAYTGVVRAYFDELTWELATFLEARHDLERSGPLDYLKLITGTPPGEERLQTDYADWLRRSKLAGRIQVEVRNVATGRVDIQVGFGTVRFFIEVKRELADSSRAALEKSYITQAAEYSGTNIQLGQLVVLDLTPKPGGGKHLSESAWVAVHRPPGSDVDRFVVVGVVPGNRPTPRQYSK